MPYLARDPRKDAGMPVVEFHGDGIAGWERRLFHIRRAGRHYGPSRVRGTGARGLIAGA
jgi:hypothetical protein